MEEERNARRYTAARYRPYPNATQSKALDRMPEPCPCAYSILFDECRGDAIEDWYFLKSHSDPNGMLPGLKKGHPEQKVDAFDHTG